MKLKEKTMNVVKKESEAAIQQMAEGKSAIDVAGEIYCKALPEKDAETGRVMAKRMDSVIFEYEGSVRAAVEDTDAWTRAQIEKQLAGQDMEERCKTLFAMLTGVSALNDVLAGEKTTDEILQEYAFDVNDASAEYESSLKEQLVAAVQASAYGTYQLRELEKALESGKTDVSIGDIINFGKHEHDAKVIMAMIAYVNAKSGAIEDLPTDISLDEIAIAVASSYDAAATAEQVAEGEISAEKGAKIMKAIGTVATFMITAILTLSALWGAGILIELSLPRILGIPLIIIAGIAFWGLFNDTAKQCVEIIAGLGTKVIRGGCALIERGARTLLSFISKHIAPKVSEIWGKVKAYFARLKEEGARAVQEESATVQA